MLSSSLFVRRVQRISSANCRVAAVNLIPKNLSTQAYVEQPKTSILANISHVPGSLHEVLKYFCENNINLTRIESRPCPKDSNGFHVFIDFEGRAGDQNTDKLLAGLQQRCKSMLVMDQEEVPWFPRHISELDALASRCLDAGTDLEADHPGFSDQKYRARREKLAAIAKQYNFSEPIPYVEYTAEEIATWGAVYRKCQSMHKDYACTEYLEALSMLEQHCGYGPDRIPQVQDISNFLKSRTGFQLRPVTGLLSARDFLNALAFRSFFCTQYIRHSSMPLYTPEPDSCHELIG
jgi:phenylalanine-4-hydroxylase